MAVAMEELHRRLLGELRHQATPFRVRGRLGAAAVVDSDEALLVWEPRRVTPVYAVPRPAVRVPLEEIGPPRPLTPEEQQSPILLPSDPFDAHTAPGVAVALRAPGGAVSGYVLDDPDLSDHVLIDFAALSWWEDDAEVVAHPRDPYQRIDVRPVTARLQLLASGTPVVDSRRARRLWETMLPVRWYVPGSDVLVAMEPSGTTSWCAYKGRATYRSAVLEDGRRLDDIAWVYERPGSDGRDVRGLLGFFTERLDVLLDGEPIGGA